MRFKHKVNKGKHKGIQRKKKATPEVIKTFLAKANQQKIIFINLQLKQEIIHPPPKNHTNHYNHKNHSSDIFKHKGNKSNHKETQRIFW